MNLLSSTLAEPQSFSPWEKLLLLALIVASAALFWRRFGPILNRILKSKKDPNFSLSPIGRRVWDFFWEVLCQAKVIRERPLARPCARLRFLGFLRLRPRDSEPYRGRTRGWLSRSPWRHRAFLLLFCGGFSPSPARWHFRPFRPPVSCAAPLARRQILLRVRLNCAADLPADGDVPGRFFVTDSSPAARALWWTHTLSLLIFLPIIPHTKHLHLVLSPATIFLSRGGFSNIPPLVGDEDFGLVAGTDLTQLVSLQAYSCVECGRCTEHCPATNTGKELNPKEIILGMRGYLNEFGPASQEPLIGKYNSHDRRLPVHHLRILRIPVPRRHRTSPHPHRPAARRGEYGRLGGRTRRQALPRTRTRIECPGNGRTGTRQVHSETGVSDL